MNRAHSFWSIGFFVTGLLGAGIAQLGVPPQVHLALAVPCVLLAVVLIFGRFTPAPSRSVEEAAPRVSRPTRPILVLVAVRLSALT
jgi:hypothetical protein